jgi:hypothetical protein
LGIPDTPWPIINPSSLTESHSPLLCVPTEIRDFIINLALGDYQEPAEPPINTLHALPGVVKGWEWTAMYSSKSIFF